MCVLVFSPLYHCSMQLMLLMVISVKEIKNQKKSSFENNAIKFKKKVKLQEETLLNSLQEQRAKMLDLQFFTVTMAFYYCCSNWLPVKQMPQTSLKLSLLSSTTHSIHLFPDRFQGLP